MPKNASANDTVDTELLRKILIVQLAIEGVSQQNIRAIVGVDINRVNQIVKLIRPKQTKSKG